MNISVLGAGRWGAFLAWYADKIGHKAFLWAREGSKSFLHLRQYRSNDYLSLPPEVILSHSLKEALSFGEIVVIAIGAQGLRSLAGQIGQFKNTEGKIFVLCMKGLEAKSGKRLSAVFREAAGKNLKTAVWVGPGHVQHFVRDIPNCMVIGSDDIEITKKVAAEFGSGLIRFYYAQDLLGTEIGAAAKNAVGIAAGMLDGLNCGSLKGALMARGASEISRLVKAMGGDGNTVYGLSHLGDYEATLFSEHSHNRRFGQALVKGEFFDKLAEGVSTLEALVRLGEEYHVELPICQAAHEIIFDGKDPQERLLELFLRPIKFEF